MSRHLLVAGAQRCGTTYLHRALDQHPDVTMARPARPEPKVFLSPEKSAKGAEWYRATYFAHATTERVLGEKSTSYLESAEAARRARAVLGEADVVVLLRDPVARAVSNWSFSTESGLEDRPLDEALRDNLRGARVWDTGTTSVSPFAYLERGRYDDFLEPWCRAFPDTTTVLFLDELVADPAVLEGLFRTLGVDPAFRPADPSGKVNQSHAHGAGQSGVDQALLEEVRDYFVESDLRLAARLGRDLPWSRHAAGRRTT